jgi:hypothetical protein
MWAEVGLYGPAIGHYGAAIALAVPAIAVLGTIIIIFMVSKSRIPEGEIRIRILGLRFRWDQSATKNDNLPDSSQPNKRWSRKKRIANSEVDSTEQKDLR